MKNKPIIILLAVLFVVSVSAAIIGFLNKDNKNSPTPLPVVEEKKTSYEYYLEEQLVQEMPMNTEENQYDFSKYICENNMTIDFNNEEWTYKTIN